MISNAKIRINLKEAKKNAEKSLTNPRKDWEIRIFKGFLYKYGTRKEGQGQYWFIEEWHVISTQKTKTGFPTCSLSFQQTFSHFLLDVKVFKILRRFLSWAVFTEIQPWLGLIEIIQPIEGFKVKSIQLFWFFFNLVE